MPHHLAQGRALLETIPEVEQGRWPAGGRRDPAPGRLRGPARPALRPVREELAELGQADAGNARASRVLGNAVLGLSCGVKAAANIAVERREASALRSARSRSRKLRLVGRRACRRSASLSSDLSP